MTPIDWATRPLKKYADFTGRAPRAEYWWFVLLYVVAYLVATILDSVLGLGGMLYTYGPITLLLALTVLVPSIAVTVRRLHDTNRSGWWIMLAVIPYLILGIMVGSAAANGDMTGLATAGLFSIVALIGAIVLLVFMVLPGTKGDNRFGPDPYAGGAASAATA